MKLEQLQQIIEIDHCASISKAAQSLYIGRSTLSESLSSLEEELGVKLFERVTTGVVPTTEGREALQIAKKIIDHIHQMQNLGKSEELYGTVTVAIGQAYGFLYADILCRFQQKHPKAELNLKICTPDQIQHELLHGNCNLALALSVADKQELIKLKSHGYQFECFGKSGFQIFVGEKNPLSKRSCVAWDEVSEQQFVTNSMRICEYAQKMMHLKQKMLYISDREIINQLVASGAMLTYMPDLFALKNPYCENGIIKTIPLIDEYSSDLVQTMLIAPSDGNLTRLEQSTLQLLREILEEVKET